MIDGILPPRRPVSAGVGKIPKQTQKPINEPLFRVPEAVAADEDSQQPILFEPPSKTTSRRRLQFKLNKKQSILVAAAFFILLGGGVAAFMLTRDNKPVAQATVPTPPPKPVEPPKPTTLPSPLTGIQVTPELSKMHVTGVMIENSPDARPQAGLKDAGVVFEAIAEGGITRFLALYQETQPDYVGPVRSARPYYIEWLRGFDAGYAHVGGSPEALSLIKSSGVKDLDQYFNSGAYQRVKTRYAPHNVYTNVAILTEASKNKGFVTSTFTPFTRKADAPSAAPTARGIDFAISSYLYNVHYDYDTASNSYLRSEGGKPHLDERSGAQLSSKVVIAMVVPFSIQADRVHSAYATTGSGKAYIFQDGAVTEGIWEKPDSNTNVRFGDANGSPLGINAGQTWITAVSAATKVSFKP